ncbi:MAG: hypothetical protein ACHQZQ_06790 [SAR324 cluster bacterium]
MVDSGNPAQDSVIDLTRRRRPRPDSPLSPFTAQEIGARSAPGGLTAEPASSAGGGEPAPGKARGEDFLALPFLVSRLEEENEPVRMWAAYHLVDRWHRQCTSFIARLWTSPVKEIRESAIHLIGKYRLAEYAFPLMRAFQANEAELGAAAGAALGRIGHEPARKLLAARLESLLDNPEAGSLELEAVAEGLLLYGDPGLWSDIHGRLALCQKNHAVYAPLFRLLCQSASEPGQVRMLAEAYRYPREVFHDPQLTQHLTEVAGRPSLSRYLQGRLGGGHSLSAVYRESLRVAGIELDACTEALLERLSPVRNTGPGVKAFLGCADALLECLAPDARMRALYSAFLAGCRGWVDRWPEATLKVREAEYHLIVSVPLSAALDGVERACLADPQAEALRITRLYQSPLLSPGFMARVLGLLGAPGRSVADAALAVPPLTGWLRDEEKDALWKLFTRQLDGVDYPFEQVLPQPWEQPVPGLLARLAAALAQRFSASLLAGRGALVDYSLEVFRRHGDPAVLDLLIEHFEPLFAQHYHGTLEAIAALPDPRFLPCLVSHYREGEHEVNRLVRFICDVHRRPYPQAVLAEPQAAAPVRASGTARLTCLACGGTFHYDLDALYVDEERIEQRQVPQPRDLWIPHPLLCKSCGQAVPFEPEERFLSDLFAELMAARVKLLTGREQASLSHIHLIAFPQLDGKTLNPAEFLERAQARLGAAGEGEDQVQVLLELGKFHLDVGAAKEAKHVFQRILAGPVLSPLALYYLGVIAFQEKNPYEARVHFSRLCQGWTREDCGGALDNPVDMAQHYLKLLEKREFKRSHFRLVPS